MGNYHRKFYKKCILFCLGLCIPIAVFFLVLSLTNISVLPVYEEMLLILTITILPPVLAAVYCLIRYLHMRKIIDIQEKQYGYYMNTENAKLIDRGASAPIYATNDTLIISGKLVLRKEFINSIITKEDRNSTGSFYLSLFCKNGRKYTIFLPDTTCVKSVVDWMHR